MVLIKLDWCQYKRGKFGPRNRCIGRMTVRHARRMSCDHRQPECTYDQGTLEVAGPPRKPGRDKKDSAFWASERARSSTVRQDTSVCTTSLWYFATAALGDKYSMVQFLLFSRFLRMIKCQHVIICSKYL